MEARTQQNMKIKNTINFHGGNNMITSKKDKVFTIDQGFTGTRKRCMNCCGNGKVVVDPPRKNKYVKECKFCKGTGRR
jgi:hypothetical protein